MAEKAYDVGNDVEGDEVLVELRATDEDLEALDPVLDSTSKLANFSSSSGYFMRAFSLSRRRALEESTSFLRAQRSSTSTRHSATSPPPPGGRGRFQRRHWQQPEGSPELRRASTCGICPWFTGDGGGTKTPTLVQNQRTIRMKSERGEESGYQGREHQ